MEEEAKASSRRASTRRSTIAEIRRSSDNTNPIGDLLNAATRKDSGLPSNGKTIKKIALAVIEH